MFAMVAILGAPTAIAGVGWTRPRAGPATALASGLGTLFVSIIGRSALLHHASALWTLPLRAAGSLLDNVLVRVAAAYVVGLGVATLVDEGGLSHQSRVWSTLRRPWVTAVGVLLPVLAIRAVAGPSSTVEKAKAALARSAACAVVEDADRFCGAVEAIALSPAGDFLVEVDHREGRGISAGRWDLTTKRRRWFAAVPHTVAATTQEFSVLVSPDSRRVAVVSSEVALLLDAETGRLVRAIDSCGTVLRTQRVRSALAFSPDGEILAVGDDGVCLESVETGGVERRLSDSAGRKADVWQVSFAGKRNVWISAGGHVEEWDAAAGERTLQLGGESLSRFALSYDGRRVFTVRPALESELVVWDGMDGSPIARTRLPNDPVAGSPSGPFAVMPDDRSALVLYSRGFRIVDPWSGEGYIGPGGKLPVFTNVATKRDGSIFAFTRQATAMSDDPTLLVTAAADVGKTEGAP
jgi:hypothetical protein